MSPAKARAGQKIFWSSDNEDVATVNKHGEVKAKANGTCTITATLADGRMSADVTVRVGAFTIPVYVTGNLQGLIDGEEIGLADIAALKRAARTPFWWMQAAVCRAPPRQPDPAAWI